MIPFYIKLQDTLIFGDTKSLTYEHWLQIHIRDNNRCNYLLNKSTGLSITHVTIIVAIYVAWVLLLWSRTCVTCQTPTLLGHFLNLSSNMPIFKFSTLVGTSWTHVLYFSFLLHFFIHITYEIFIYSYVSETMFQWNKRYHQNIDLYKTIISLNMFQY